MSAYETKTSYWTLLRQTKLGVLTNLPFHWTSRPNHPALWVGKRGSIMRGRILSVATNVGPGIISADDGRRYRYTAFNMRGMPGREGHEVDFEPHEQEAREIYVICSPLPMNFDAKRDWVAFYLSPNGRVSRREYWLYGFLVVSTSNLLIGWIPVIGQLFMLVTFWVSIALAAKRFHDVNRSAWFLLAPLAPLALAGFGLLMMAQRSTEGAGMNIAIVFGLAAIAAQLWILFGVLIRSGDQGPNRYGSAPTI